MTQSKMKTFLKSRLFLVTALLIVLLIVTYIVAPQAYTLPNLKQILNNLSFMTIMGMGVACLLLSGGIDFSTSAHASIGMCFFAMLLQKFPNMPWLLAALVAIIFGIAAGAFNAYLGEGLKMMPFIATIGMQTIWNGIGLWLTAGNIISITNEPFTKISTIYIFGFIPVWFIFALVVFLIYYIITTRTKFGRSIAMVGGNPTASRLAGINPSRVRSLMFMNNGFLASIGALVWASQQKQGSPTGLTGSAPEMTALTASMLGGVAFGGGAGTLGGAFLGIILIEVLSYALQAMNASIWLITLVEGSLLVIALTIDRFTNRGGAGAVGMPGMSK